MKILKVSLKIIAAIVAVALIAGVVVVSSLRKSGLPELNGEKSVAGLTADVRVIRDERGVPHIYASNEHDLYFMTGYITAQERLWQMDMVRHATQGRLSELFKRDMTETDYFLRALGMSRKSQMLLEKEDPAILATLQAYCRRSKCLDHRERQEVAAGVQDTGLQARTLDHDRYSKYYRVYRVGSGLIKPL
ncbi:MAG: penicillin acylase family protein [Marinilabiliales bacterium]|nr:penicillin acylase family protein [Marinilabiliales bacterium]